MLVLQLGDPPGGQAYRVDHVGEWNRPFQVQQGDVTVQILLPVVLRVDYYFIDCHDLLNVWFIPGKFHRFSSVFHKFMMNSYQNGVTVLF